MITRLCVVFSYAMKCPVYLCDKEGHVVQPHFESDGIQYGSGIKIGMSVRIKYIHSYF